MFRGSVCLCVCVCAQVHNQVIKRSLFVFSHMGNHLLLGLLWNNTAASRAFHSLFLHIYMSYSHTVVFFSLNIRLLSMVALQINPRLFVSYSLFQIYV